MKYVMSWTTRYHGSATDNENTAKRGVETFTKWTPPAGLKFEQFVGRIDGVGGDRGGAIDRHRASRAAIDRWKPAAIRAARPPSDSRRCSDGSETLLSSAYNAASAVSVAM